MDWMDLEDGSPERVAEELVTWQQTFSWQWFATKKDKSVKLRSIQQLALDALGVLCSLQKIHKETLVRGSSCFPVGSEKREW